jgi:superfamily I DNA/RNA helicase
VHQAKGLEWETVFIINMSAGGFPNERAMREVEGLEEERRLFYVAITRAKKELILSYPADSGFAQGGRGGWGETVSGPSMFLEEIDADLLSTPPSFLASLADLDDANEDIHYISENRKFKPGSFLREVEDL